MSNFNRDFIADVMSGDEAQNSNRSSNRQYDVSDEETVVGGEDATIANLLTESENIVRSLSNLSSYKTSIVDEKDFERKPWQSLNCLRPNIRAHGQAAPRSMGTSDYVSDELSARPHHVDSMSNYYINQGQVQTFPDTTSLLKTLRNELEMRTSELHKMENEYFNLRANFENLNGRLENAQSELSSLRSQAYAKDKQIRFLTEKVGSLTLDVSASRSGYEVARSELENMRARLDQSDQGSDQRNESLSKEVKKRDEVIEQLRVELTECSRNNRTSRTSEISESQLKEKAAQFENAIKTKEQKILAQQRQIVEYEHEIQALKEAHLQESNARSEVGQLEQEMDLLKEQLENARIKNESINETLSNSKRFYDEFKETSERSIQDYARISQKWKSDYRELEEKHRESLNTLKQRGDSNKRLNDDIKELTDKLKSLENLLAEKDSSLHSLNLEKIENHQKIETLKSQLVEGSINETSINISYKKEIESKQGYLDQLSKETIQLNRSLDEVNDKLRIRDSTIDQLNNKLVDLESLNSNHKKAIQNLENNICQLSYREKMLEDTQRDNIKKIELMELENKNTKEQIESAQEDLRKVSMEKRELERDLQRKDDRILQENNTRSYEIEELRLELKKVNQMLTIEQESGRHLSGEMSKLLTEYNKLNSDFAKVSEESENREVALGEMTEKEERLLSHNSYLEEELTKMKLALEDSGEELDRIRKSWDSREDALAICKEESMRQKTNNLDLINKIEQRDQLLQSLTTETGKLKQKYQNKTSEMTKLTDQNLRLKESLQELESSTAGLNQKYEEMKNRKEKETYQLRKDLEELQNQYSNCYDDLIQNQEHTTKCLVMEKECALKLAKLQEEMGQQQMDYDEMEAELNVIRAKHRACQEELSRRDEELLMIRSEVQNYQRDMLSFQSERQTFQKEIDRWREKCSETQDKCQRQQLESDALEDCISEKDHKIDELQRELQVSKQENENHLRIMEQLKADLGVAKSTNNDRYNHFQAIIESLRTEIETKNQEARFLEENCSKYRNEINRLKSEHEDLSQKIEANIGHIEDYKEKLQSKEEECQHWMKQTQSAQYLNEEVKISLDTLEKEITHFKQQLTTNESKLRSQADGIVKLKNEKNEHYKSFMDCKRQLDLITRDKEELQKSYEDNLIKVKKYEKCIRDLNEELAVAQVEMTNITNKNARLESELSQTSILTSHKHSTIETLECKLAKIKSNFNTYKNSHKSDDTEVGNLNSLLLQQTKKCAELEDILNGRNKEREMMIIDREKKETEIFELKETFIAMKNDIENLRREREEKRIQLDEVQKKYQYEMKKLKVYSKEVEEDISSLHRTIEDKEKQLNCKDLELENVNERTRYTGEDLEQKKKEIVLLEQRIREFEMEKRHNDSLSNAEVAKQSGVAKEMEQLQNEIKESRSLILELTNQKTKYETKCSSLETMMDKAERKASHSESELKKLQSTFYAYSKELEELRNQHKRQAMDLENTKSEYGRFTEEYKSLKNEKLNERKKGATACGEMENLKTQLDNSLENINMLKEQVEQQEEIIVELQSELLQERKKVVDLQNNDYQKKKALNEMENEAGLLARNKQELLVKLKDKERMVNAKQNETEKLTGKVRQLTESLIEKDNKIKLLEKRMQMIEEEKEQMKEWAKDDKEGGERQISTDRSDYVSTLESSIASNQTQIDQLRSEIRQCNSKNYELSIDRQMLEEDIQRLKQEKGVLQTKMLTPSPNTGETSGFNNRKTQCLEEENESLQRMIKRLRHELDEKDRLMLSSHEDSIKSLTIKLNQAQEQDRDNDNRTKKLRNDLESKIREISELKEVIVRLREENLRVISELEHSEDTIKTLQGQNSAIVDNFNVWVQEQKLANEKLGEKIREQNRTIHELRREKELLQRDKCQSSFDQHLDRDTSSGSSSCADERVLLHNQLRASEDNYERVIQGKNKLIEELQCKVNDRISEISKLKQQILILENDQQNMKIELQRAVLATESYKARSSSQHERLGLIKTQLGSSNLTFDIKDRADAEEYDSKDKQYWIQRVGELSDELQQCREYWSNKVRELSNNVESSSVSVDTLTPISS